MTRAAPRDADGVRAVTIPSYGGPDVLTLADVADPAPGPDEILVRVTHSACNRADTLQRMGGYPDPVRRDVEIPGLEYAGTVAALGARVTNWEIGDRVMGIEIGRVLRRARRDPLPPGAADPRHDRDRGRGRDPRGVPHRMGRARRAGWADERAVGSRPCRRVRVSAPPRSRSPRRSARASRSRARPARSKRAVSSAPIW